MKNKFFFLILLLLFSVAGCSQKSSKKAPVATATYSIEHTALEWQSKLSPEQYYILREKGTEKPFSGKFLFTKDKGTYRCGGCEESLFTNDMKFESHCGWPSFDKEIAGGKIIQTEDNSNGMQRIEISCARCGGHLGHIFDDGPTETGKRYCVNSASLSFEPLQTKKGKNELEKITLGGGCFWCIEAIFEDLKGVIKVESGYSGGKTMSPSYTEVTSGKTGHAEVVQITYDATVLPLEQLLEVFFKLHDPTTIHQQGNDIGTQYRSAIFYHTEEQKKIANNIITILEQNKAFDKPIVTEVTAFKKFYKAEDYHQEYFKLNNDKPYCKLVIQPKIDKLHQIFKDKIKTTAIPSYSNKK